MLASSMNHRRVAQGLALLVITVLVYLPAIRHGGFIWDDEDYVIHNKTLRDAGGLKDIWTKPRATPQYYPLVHTSYWIEYQLWGLDPTGYHVTNVLLHALAAVLLWRVLRRLEVPGAWLAATLFAVHPVQVESVAWITERKNLLSGVFYLGAALSYLRWVETRAGGERGRVGYLVAFVLFAAALLSKTVTVTLPAALLLVMWWKGAFVKADAPASARIDVRRVWDQVLPLVPFFAVGLAMSSLTVWLERHHVGATGVEWDLSFIDRCLIAGRAPWFYAAKLLWPAGLCFNYPRWEIDAGAWWQYLYPLAAVSVVVSLWIARRRIGRGPLVAVLFFAGTLFPALGFFDVYPMRYSFVADHFQYLASIGFLALVAAVVVRLGRRTGPSASAAEHRSRLAAGVALGILATLAWRQCGIYRNLETLWLDTIEKNPDSWMAYNNLGKLYIHEGRPAEAIPVLKRALKYRPDRHKVHKNIGVALSKLRRKDEAIEQYYKALEIEPDDAGAYSNIGAALAADGQLEEAIPMYEKALEIAPGLAATHSNLGKALGQLGRTDEAIPHHERALEHMPDLAPVHLNYGETLHAAGRIREAEERFRKAIELDPSLAAGHINLGRIARSDQLLPAAMDHFRRAVKYAPHLAEAHSSLAGVLAAIGRVSEAEHHFGEAARLDPRSAGIRIGHAELLLQRDDKRAAREEYLAALELVPDNPDILFSIGVIEQQLGNVGAAEGRLRKVLELAPTHAAAHNGLAVLLAGKGQVEEAVALLRKAVELIPGNAEFHNNLGVMLVRLGNRREALEALEEAVRLNPDYGEARKNLDDLRQLPSGKEDRS
ncbi:MAG: tetratricopeptide repeat protein [Verrucomicrobia bacterium]|jgi:protein O-mannosyl-transferase|nr:tetratricopeptide repeat protein [Verrucomicrobiota bacterium]MBT7068895.1 tetratricopeptide repeat protein [Verrucomicrobiota bacterium]MBT7701948.1 tetratricopeptide repeat protein [Verrucomicrobiota bacterium]